MARFGPFARAPPPVLSLTTACEPHPRLYFLLLALRSSAFFSLSSSSLLTLTFAVVSLVLVVLIRSLPSFPSPVRCSGPRGRPLFPCPLCSEGHPIVTSRIPAPCTPAAAFCDSQLSQHTFAVQNHPNSVYISAVVRHGPVARLCGGCRRAGCPRRGPGRQQLRRRLRRHPMRAE